MSLAQRSDSKEELTPSLAPPPSPEGLPNEEDILCCYQEAIKHEVFGPTWDGKLRLVHLQRMAEDLQLQTLSSNELNRIWESICGSRDGSIDVRGFFAAVSSSVILCSLIKSFRENLTHGFEIPDSYDFSRSTNQNYRSDGLNFYGDFAEIRQGLDYTYHVNYTKARQDWQDHAIRTVITRTRPQPSPWLVYTCGPMGVGKGYTLAWMSEHGFFPLENIVHVDPDAFKMMMPEWSKYVEHDRDSAGTMCHRESAFMMEIAQGAAMQRGQNIWIDGSLRDADHYAKQFRAVREQFPLYQISIFYVYASEATIFARVAERKEKTGRDVPDDLVKQSLAAMDHSLNVLTPLCDFVARIENEGNTPVLRAFEKVDKSGCWNSIRSRFARQEEFQFPDFLPPLHLTQLPAEYIKAIHSVDTPTGKENVVFLHLSVCEDNTARKLATLPDFKTTVNLPISPGSEVTLSEKARQLAMIPAEARSFFFIYPQYDGTESHPLSRLNLKRHGFTDQEILTPLLQLLRAGGFGYSDKLHDVIRVNVISSMSERSILQFGKPIKVSIRLLQEIPESRFRPVSTKSISSRGGVEYAWILPSEEFAGKDVGGQHGSFIFLVRMNETQVMKPDRDSHALVKMASTGETLIQFPVISANS